MRYFLSTLAFAGAIAAAPAHAGKLRTNPYWAGDDLPVSCDVVRQIAPKARLMPRRVQRALIEKYHITWRMMRQARACLR